jgi:hypothetical protein
MSKMALVIFGTTALLGVGCSNNNDGSSATPGTESGLTRDDARKADKADWPTDYCEKYGWYGDGVFCDDFCPLPDPDCTSDCIYLGGTCVVATHPPDPPHCINMGMDVSTAVCGQDQVCCVPKQCADLNGTCVAATDPPDPPHCINMGMDVSTAVCDEDQVCCVPKPQ